MDNSPIVLAGPCAAGNFPIVNVDFLNPAHSRQAGGRVQSVERAFKLLELMAEAGGDVALSQLADASKLPLPTIHRIMRTLVNNGYVRQQLKSRRYELGPRLIRLGETAGQNLGAWARPYLARMAEELGETTNLAILDGDQMVYVAQVPSTYPMRMCTEVGRRVDLHCTAVGKAVLADMRPTDVTLVLFRTRMTVQTGNTIVDPAALRQELESIRLSGFAQDRGEQEVGVKCLAVAIPDAPVPAAISISGPEARMDRLPIRDVVAMLQQTAGNLSLELNRPTRQVIVH